MRLKTHCLTTSDVALHCGTRVAKKCGAWAYIGSADLADFPAATAFRNARSGWLQPLALSPSNIQLV